MRALVSMILSLALLVLLLRAKVRIGRAMMASAVTLAVLLKVTPVRMYEHLIFEWQTLPLPRTTPYLVVSLTALLLFVNVIGSAMQETGVSNRLVPAMHGLFRSRRLALAVVPFIMGMLPTPGGTMLSAPMVRQLADSFRLDRAHQAAINFHFRHQLESVWPLFPAVPLVQGIFGVSAFAVISHNIVISIAGLLAGAVFLLTKGIPPRGTEKISHPHFLVNLGNMAHAIWPIALTALLYAAFNLPPACGVLIAILAFLLLHRVPFARWPTVFKAAKEPELVLLVLSALFFKFNLEAGNAIPQVVDVLTKAKIPSGVIVFLLPMLVAYLTGLTMPTVAITFPFLTAFIGTGQNAKMGMETLAFAGVICGWSLTPIHLCLSLSAGYFEAPLLKIVAKLIPPVIVIALTGAIMALLNY